MKEAGNGIEGISDGAAWEALCEALRRAGHAVLEAAPDDAFDRAEGLRYASRLARHFLRATLEESDAAAAVLSTETPRIGLDNPDYGYAGAKLSGRFRYVLRGRMHDAHRIGFGTYYGSLGTQQGLQRSGYLTSDELELAPDGSFEIAIACDEEPGNWLPMIPKTNQLTIRQTLLERRTQQPASFELVRTDGGAVPAPLDPVGLARGLERAGGITFGAIVQFLGWTRSFAAHPHEIRPLPEELLGFAAGVPDTQYLFGYWELADDQAWVIELEPPACDYWNIQVGNHWLESFDYRLYDANLNHHTALKADDGSVRAVVAQRDPGVPNWLQTAGHRRGALALRWVGATQQSIPKTRVVELGEL